MPPYNEGLATVQEDLVRNPVETSIDEVPTKRFVRAVVFNPEGKALVVERSDKSSFEKRKFELPGGSEEPGVDLTSDAALLRELFEETGLKGQLPIQTPMTSKRIMAGGKNKHTGKVAFTTAKVITVESSDVSLSHEHQSFKWCTKQELTDLYERGDLSKTSLDLVTTALLH